MKNIAIPEQLSQFASRHFVLLESQNQKKQLDTVQLNVSGYGDVMHLISDIVKVCMLALEGETSCKRIPEPNVNISGVLGIILDLIPYEEAELLDAIRESVLNPIAADDWIEDNLFLRVPAELRLN